MKIFSSILFFFICISSYSQNFKKDVELIQKEIEQNSISFIVKTNCVSKLNNFEPIVLGESFFKKYKNVFYVSSMGIEMLYTDSLAIVINNKSKFISITQKKADNLNSLFNNTLMSSFLDSNKNVVTFLGQIDSVNYYELVGDGNEIEKCSYTINKKINFLSTVDIWYGKKSKSSCEHIRMEYSILQKSIEVTDTDILLSTYVVKDKTGNYLPAKQYNGYQIYYANANSN